MLTLDICICHFLTYFVKQAKKLKVAHFKVKRVKRLKNLVVDARSSFCQRLATLA